jgi:hypothetical protein
MNFLCYSFMLVAIAQMCKVLSVTFSGKKEVTANLGTCASGNLLQGWSPGLHHEGFQIWTKATGEGLQRVSGLASFLYGEVRQC